MLKHPLRILFELGIGCVFLLAAVLFWVSHYIDTDEFRTVLTETLESAIGREVELNGELNIDLWPGFNLEVTDLSIAEDPAFGTDSFAHFKRILINIRLIPLLSERLDIRSVVIEKMALHLIRNESGQLNLTSILKAVRQDTAPEIPVDYSLREIELHGLEVVNASISFRMENEKNGYQLNGINLKTGSISPESDVPFSISSSFAWKDGGVQSDLTLKGMFETGLNGGEIALKDATMYASVGGAFLPEGASPGEFIARIVMDWDKQTIALDGLRARFLGLSAEGTCTSGNLSKEASASGHITVRPFSPAKIISKYWPRLPIKSVDGLRSASFTSFFDMDESGLDFKNLALSLDDIVVRGRVGFKRYSVPIFSFGLKGNTLDLDKYLPLFMTDTPFVWGDFGLEFFRGFRGQGAIRADGFKVLDTLISDIRLSVKGDGSSILLDAGAIKEGQASLGGKAEIFIGKDNSSGDPTMAFSTNLTAESHKDGFAFLQGKQSAIGGKAILKIHAKTMPMVCSPKARSIDVLRHFNVDGSLSFGGGESRFTSSTGKSFIVDYSTADMAFTAASIPDDREGYYGYTVTGNIKTKGGDDIESAAIAASGPVSFGIDAAHVHSPGLDVKVNMVGGFMPEKSQRLDIGGRVAFDSDSKRLSVADGFVNGLDARGKVRVDIADWNKPTQAFGHFEIVQANPRRIIYLLSGVTVQTNDTEALKKAGISAQYSMDEKSFILSELKGNLDGMNFKGHVVGNNLSNPMLSFSLVADPLDIDRYLPPSRHLTPEERRSGQVAKAGPVRLPLEFFRALRLNGKVVLDELKLAKIRARSVDGVIQADKGKIHVSGVKGIIHGGRLTADWKGDVAPEFLTTQLLLHVEDMQAGSLMLDLANREYLQGETDVDFDLESVGVTDDDIVANLQGKAWIRVSDGSFKFTGYNQKPSVNSDKVSEFGDRRKPRTNKRTLFQKGVGNFSVKNGVFTADKFRVEAPPLLQSYGQGGFSLPDSSIDFSIRNDFMVVPSVTIRLVGELTDPEVKIPKGKIVNDTVRNILSLPEKSFNFLRDLFQ